MRSRYRRVACRWEVWQLINLTGDIHPIHIHLNPFHVLARRPIMVTVPDGGITDTATSARVHLGRSPDDALEHEDRDMMRPIVVMPEQLGPFMS